MQVSMVMAVYNGSWCIERALDSVILQTRRPQEILVCDDGSTDGTPELVEDRYRNDVTVIRLPHRNAAAARFEGLERSSGDWIAFMDADDFWFPEKLERQQAFIENHPEVRMLTSDGLYESPEGVIRESWLSDYFDPVQEMVGDLAPLLVERCFPLLSSTMVERNAYREVGGIERDLFYSYDYDLWLKMAARFPAAVMAERLVSYYSSAGALSRNYEARYRDDLAVMKRIQKGVLGDRTDLRRRAAVRAAALEFDIGVLCFRTRRFAEARTRMRGAIARGPLKRRLIAATSAVIPGPVLVALMRNAWLKSSVQEARHPSERLVVGGGS